VVRELDAIAAAYRYPITVVSDNGTELTSSAVLTWSQDCAICCHYVAPGKPTQNPERICRELQWQATRRMPERYLVQLGAACPGRVG
jgi:putative transposase